MIIKRLLTGAIKIITLSFISLTFVNNAFATETITTSIGVKPSLTLTMPTTTLNLSLDPSSTTFGYKDLPISVGTNNETGYKLTISTNNDDTNLVNTADSNTVIETLPPSSPTTAGYTDSDFVANKWGYKNGLSNNYFPFNSGDIVLENTGPVNDDNTTLRFATKIDYMQPEGTYSTTFNFSLVANPLTPTIQNIAPTRCISTPLTALDIRDNQEYIIQRLADGNCWMMTNLNLGDTNNYPLIATQLDSSNTNMNSSTAPISSTTFTGWKKSSFVGAFTAGEYITVTSANSKTGSDTDPVTGTKYGTLYNYCATTAGTYCYASGSGAVDATQDICPAGWRLPTASPSGEYQYLYSQSEYNTYAKMRASVADGGAAFTLAGHVPSSGGGPDYQGGDYAHYWSSNIYSSDNMYELFLGPTYGVLPSNNNRRSYGFSIRCVLKES